MTRAHLTLPLLLALIGCGSEGGGLLDAGSDAGSTLLDAGTDTGLAPTDSGTDAGPSPTDAGDAGDDAGALLEVAEFTDTARSRASWGACLEEAMPVLGYAPVDSGTRYPLFVWTVGTFAQYDSGEVYIILREMAARGFVAVSPSYDNGAVNGCFNAHEKTMCIFDATQPDSLVAKMCARPDVDCDRGILVGGHSQGAGLALLAHDYDTRIRGVYAMGANCKYLSSVFDPMANLCDPEGAATETDCLHHSVTTIPLDRIRIVNGESDDYGTELEYEHLSGKSCPPGTLDCLNADGSGWYRIADSDVEDGLAEHCYIVNSTDGAWCPGIDEAHPYDTGWIPPARLTWSLITNLEWLASRADPAAAR